MEPILKSDVFFFITSISVVIITIVLIVAGFYFIKLLRNFYRISKILKSYAEDTETELRDMGEHIRNSPLFTFIFGREKNKTDPEKRSRKSV